MDMLSVDENQLDRRAHQQLLRQRHHITKSSKVLLKCYPSSLISDYDKRCCDKIIILSKTRKKQKQHPLIMRSMYWKNILVFSVIVLINLATKECTAARQLEGMFMFIAKRTLIIIDIVMMIIPFYLRSRKAFQFDLILSIFICCVQ
jgi:hypothetical protein